MSWEFDIPSLPFKKPEEIEKLEQMDYDQREAMDTVEMKSRINGVALNIAVAYHKHNGNDPRTCIAIIQSALSELGNSLTGRFGTTMIGIRESASHLACKNIFPEQYELIYPVMPEAVDEERNSG